MSILNKDLQCLPVEITITCRNLLPWPAKPCAIWPLLAFSISSHAVTHLPTPSPTFLTPESTEAQWCCQTDCLRISASPFASSSVSAFSPHDWLLPPVTPPKSIPASLLTLQALLCAYHLADCTVMNAVFPLIEMELKWDVGSLSTVSPFVALSLACRPCSVHVCGVREWSQGKLREDRGLVWLLILE